jgi:hypothetical protein
MTVCREALEARMTEINALMRAHAGAIELVEVTEAGVVTVRFLGSAPVVSCGRSRCLARCVPAAGGGRGPACGGAWCEDIRRDGEAYGAQSRRRVPGPPDGRAQRQVQQLSDRTGCGSALRDYIGRASLKGWLVRKNGQAQIERRLQTHNA